MGITFIFLNRLLILSTYMQNISRIYRLTNDSKVLKCRESQKLEPKTSAREDLNFFNFF